MEKLKRIQELFKSEKRVRLLAVLGAVGVLLICLSEFISFPSKQDAQAQTAEVSASDYCDTTEEKLEKIISQVEGAGRVQVMMTLESSDEKVYAADEKTDTKTGADTQQKSTDEKYVLIDNGTGDDGILLKTNAPKVKGVIIVCDGGDNPTVANQITDAVSAALGIGANRVSVLKMKQTEE
ncbi:MAG: hypothetical protein ACI4LB_01990 [Candidatus Fimenecus sp.]